MPAAGWCEASASEQALNNAVFGIFVCAFNTSPEHKSYRARSRARCARVKYRDAATNLDKHDATRVPRPASDRPQAEPHQRTLHTLTILYKGHAREGGNNNNTIENKEKPRHTLLCCGKRTLWKLRWKLRTPSPDQGTPPLTGL